MLIWSLERVGQEAWAGTTPAGLLRSADFGQSWQLVDALWQRAERLEWFGSGYDTPGIHSTCPHPTQASETLLGISCGGAQRQLAASGKRADFMPPEKADNPNVQDPHRIQRCTAQPQVPWCQHHGGIWRSTDNAALPPRAGRGG